MKFISSYSLFAYLLLFSFPNCILGQSCQNSENLAAAQSTAQSSLYGLGVSSIAVDGDTDGSRGPWGANPSITHTQNELQPWWQVELAESQALDSLVLYNRTDCCADRLSDFYVLISETPFQEGASLNTLLVSSSVDTVFVEGTVAERVNVALGLTGKYVRIQLLGQGILNVAEVEVWGCSEEPSCINEADQTALMKVDQITATSARIDWSLTNTSVVGYEYYRYREQGEIDWIEGVVVNVGNEVRLDAELTALEPATTYEWEARILCEESAEWVYVPGPDFTTLSTPSDPTADLRFLPSMECPNGIFKARIQIRGASIDSFSVGTTSILCTYNDAALQFSSYQSLNFDGSDLCVVGVASSWDDHTVDGISISGVFNLTMVLNSEQFSCPSIQPNEWTDIGEISFSILDEGLSPSLFFNISNTNFNIDQPNDGSVQVGKGNFQGLEGNILECEENNPPVASFTATPRSGQAPLVVNFDASASTDSDGSISSYEWDLGNGLTSSGESFQYTYTAKGDNIVKLVVTDNLGAKDTIAIMVSVSEPNQPPVASFIVDPQTGSVPLLAEFFANGSSDSDGEIVAYNWDFGDGTGGEGRYITHVYDAVGSYTARLIVVDNQGANDTVTQTITVVPQSDLDPFADLRIVDSLDCENNTLYTTLQIRAANGQVFKIGTSSILLKFNESALQFQNYQSLSFDGSDRCIAGIVEAWDQHSYNVISFPGLFNLTMLLNTEQFSCPEITQNEWISIGTLEFSIKDERLSPEILFDRLNTNFNFDEPNDGSVQVGKGEFTGFTGNVLSCSPSDCQSTNLAFGKPSSQSSTYGNGVPTIAVDGNTAGQGSPWGANASLQHTQSEASPWWEVDLEEIANIDSIRVYNRTSCCQDRLSNVYVLVASEPFSPSASLEDLLTNSNITHVQLTGIPSDTILTFSFAATGRYVRLQLPDDGVNSPLHIAEVEVYGCVDENQVQPISFSVNTTNAICLSESVGVISIENLSGGQGPYSFSIDGGCSFTSQAVFQNLDWGDYLVVVKDSVGNSESQMVHIVSEENGLAITEGQRIIDPLQAQGRMTGNHFGYKLVVQGDEALVGARWDEPDFTGLPDNFNSGSVGVLQKQGEDWVLVDRLFPDTPRLEAFFGIALAISGDWALIGSYEESNGLDAGAAYFFHKENGVWVQKQRVVGSGVQAGDFFGSGLGISGKTAVVGSFLGEEAYVYEYEENQWVEKKKLVANDGQAARKFGSRAVVSGERILIAARSDNAEQGAVYVSEKVGDSWEIVDKITALDGQMGDNFGVSISLQGDRALIGAFKAERNGLQTGGAYLYEYQSGSWEQQEKWMLENGADGDEFGAFVHLQADIALVGANKRGSSGALFMFKEGEAEWKEYPEIVAANSVGGASFGLAAGISKDELLVGAFGEDSPEADNGAVYTFDISCTEDTTGCIMPTNLAWGKAARQSTTYGDGLASIAVDGIVDGQGSPWGTNASLQHTQSETSPWWEVDLGENSAVESVSIYNRTSCCQDRLRDLYVLISPEPFGDTTRLADLLSDPFISHAQLTGIPTDSIISIPISVSGRYVRIQLPDDGVNSALHVAEVEVYGCVEEVLTPCEKNFEALMEIYNQTGGINWRRQANWGVGCPCENNWEGVICGDSNTVTLLTLGGNNLVGEIPETLGDLIYLEELVLAGNPITQLPQSIGKLKSVHTFYLDQTLVAELPNSFGELSALTNLYLMGSILTELPASFGNLSSLRSLYIANSSLTSLPTTFGDLGALEFAEFNENQLQFLPESIGNLRELQTLRLFKNQIVLLPPSIGNLTQLKELDLGENLLTTLPQTVGNLNQLQHLSLIGNELEELPAAIGDLDVITNLFLDDNPTLVCLPSSMKVYCDRAVDIRTNGSPVDWQAFCEEGLHACEIDSSACATPSNLALNQSTNQSSTYGDGFASIAVDGDKDGSRGPWGATASIQHTLSESQPWWEVDLGVQAQIESVELTNRSDCCNERLANFYVLISEMPFTTSASLDELLADTSIYQFFFAGQAGIQQSISLETQGRYMRIQLTGSGILHMAEVEVRGCIKEPTNESQRFAQANDGLAGNPQEFALNAYPNPFSQTILLELGADWEANTHIRVYNSLGQKLYSQVTNDQQEYELGKDWPAGIYWIEVRSGEAMKTLQIQKN